MQVVDENFFAAVSIGACAQVTFGIVNCAASERVDVPGTADTFLKMGYHGLTLVFVWQTAVYAWAAFGPSAQAGMQKSFEIF